MTSVSCCDKMPRVRIVFVYLLPCQELEACEASLDQQVPGTEGSHCFRIGMHSKIDEINWAKKVTPMKVTRP